MFYDLILNTLYKFKKKLKLILLIIALDKNNKVVISFAF